MASRRAFLHWLVGLGAVLAGCARRDQADDGAPGSTGLEPSRSWQWQVRWIRDVPERRLIEGEDAWRLRLDGLVVAPRELTLGDLRALPAVSQRSRMRCVEGWSAPATWQGVLGSELFSLVERRSGADYVTVHASDGYESTLPVAELAEARSLFAFGMDDRPLPDVQGYPLRLVVPKLYGYKGVKAVTRLEFVDRRKPGFWESRGYDDVGVIQPGRDLPLDLGGSRQIGGGEITEY